MKTTTRTKEAPQQALLFIPDITGFTDFVSHTEIDHAQHIIRELLEVIIDANDIGMEISEIEGDAILFYRLGRAPTAAELLAQVQKMFLRFHTHLKKYETHRICHCGACRTANDLSIKFIAHYGDISLNQVKSYQSLFGKDVIVAHRLMKNDIRHREYALFTHHLVQACKTWVEIEAVSWAPLQQSEQQYDTGTIRYCYLQLDLLMEHIPELKPEDYSMGRARTSILRFEGEIEAPIDQVFNVLADLPWRSRWIVGTDPVIDQLNHEILQAGATHHCLAGEPALISHDFQVSEEVITFTETNVKKTTCALYTLKKAGPGRTQLEAEWFIRPNPVMQTLFRLFMKKKFRRQVLASFKNLNDYCVKLRDRGEEHRYQLVLEPKLAGTRESRQPVAAHERA
jgi:hypothetical protein